MCVCLCVCVCMCVCVCVDGEGRGGRVTYQLLTAMYNWMDVIFQITVFIRIVAILQAG